MLRYQIATVVRKPEVRVKMVVITLLFVFNIVSQIRLLTVFAEDMGGKGTLTVAALLCHIFNYLDLYNMVIFVGFILLMPDIVHEEYMEKQYLMLHKNRLWAARSACLRLVVFSALYVLWLVFLVILTAGVGLRNFSLEWPHFLKTVLKQYSGHGDWSMSLIMLPEGALEYHPAVAAGLVILRSFLGFLFLAELACLLRLLTGKIQNGILCIAALIAYAGIIYYCVGGGYLLYCKSGVPVAQSCGRVDLIKTTIIPFFTFRSVTDDFTEWIRYGIFMGLALVIITGIGIVCYYRKGDLGDADRAE